MYTIEAHTRSTYACTQPPTKAPQAHALITEASTSALINILEMTPVYYTHSRTDTHSYTPSSQWPESSYFDGIHNHTNNEACTDLLFLSQSVERANTPTLPAAAPPAPSAMLRPPSPNKCAPPTRGYRWVPMVDADTGGVSASSVFTAAFIALMNVSLTPLHTLTHSLALTYERTLSPRSHPQCLPHKPSYSHDKIN